MRFVAFVFFIFYSLSVGANSQTVHRIITLSPHLAELVYTLGSGEKLVGVIERSDYPEAVKKTPRIGSATGLDIERILSIKPDLILAWEGGSREVDIRKLRSLGLRVVSIKSESLQDIPLSISQLGEVLNTSQKANEIIRGFQARVQQLKQKYQNTIEKKIFIEISSKPLMGLTHLHSFSSGLELCGLKNIFSKTEKSAIVTDIESILNNLPDYVLVRSSKGNDIRENRQNFYLLKHNRLIQFVTFDEDAAFRQTPRLLDAVDEVCRSTSE